MKSSKTREAPKVATYAERRQMEDLILLNSTPVAEANGMERAWKEGWNFERVAKTAGARFKTSHARRVAKALGVTVAVEVPPTDGFRRAFAALEARVAALEAMMGVGLQRIFAAAPSQAVSGGYSREFCHEQYRDGGENADNDGEA